MVSACLEALDFDAKVLPVRDSEMELHSLGGFGGMVMDWLCD